jgi:glycosyltransferase involved in cell wall biosynthesis
MKILCVHQGAELYGSDRSFIQCVSAIAETYGRSNVDVLIPAEGTIASELRKHVDNVNVSNLWIARKSKLPRFLLQLAKLPFALSSALSHFRKYDKVYINTVVVVDYILISFIFAEKAIIHVREIPTGFIGKILKSLVVSCGASLIFNSKATMMAFGKEFKSRAEVIYNGVASPDNVEVSTYDGERRLRLLLIGRINDWKGQDLAIEAMSRLKQDGHKLPELRIVGEPFAGKEYLLSDLRKQVNEADLSSDIAFYPFITDPSCHFNWCDAVLVPSKKPEPFGRVAIEAMSYGRPVIAAAHGGLTEIVVDKVTGSLFTPLDCVELTLTITDMMKNSALIHVYGKNGKELFSKKFTTYSLNKSIISAISYLC